MILQDYGLWQDIGWISYVTRLSWLLQGSIGLPPKEWPGGTFLCQNAGVEK